MHLLSLSNSQDFCKIIKGEYFQPHFTDEEVGGEGVWWFAKGHRAGRKQGHPRLAPFTCMSARRYTRCARRTHGVLSNRVSASTGPHWGERRETHTSPESSVEVHVLCWKGMITLSEFGCYNSIDWVSWITNTDLSQFWRLENLESKHWKILCLVRTLFPVYKCPFSYCVITWHQGWRGLPGVSFIRPLIPFTRAPPAWPHHLPKAPYPNTVPLGIRSQHLNLEGTPKFTP